MKQRVLFSLCVILTLFAAACAPLKEPGPGSIKDITESYQPRRRENFSAWDFTEKKRYLITAVHLAENETCAIYGEESAWVTLETAEKIAREFQDAIYPKITGIFGFPLDADEDGKLTILLLNIRDSNAAAGSYLAGYFDPIDMYSPKTYPDSNARDMLYMDTDPGKPGEASFYSTIAHELQHLINFSVTLRNRAAQNTGRTSAQDTWIDEGLASAAEYVYGGKHLASRISHFNAAGAKDSITRGNNFFIWDEDKNVLDEYATVYLFFQWLRIQAGDQADPYGIYRDIINSPYADYQAVLYPAIRRINPGLSDWETLLKTWLLANYVNSTRRDPVSPLLGYRGEIATKVSALGGESLIDLKPGEGVFSVLDDQTEFSPPAETGESPHIRYVGVTEAGDLQESFAAIKGKEYRLLTFNANEDHAAAAEQGKLTGRGSPDTRGGSRRAASSGLVPLDGSSRLPGWKAPLSAPSLAEPGGRD
jgi:hypothetical protein